MPARPAYFAVSPLLLSVDSLPHFEVYLKRDQFSYVLYCAPGERFTRAHRQRLHDFGLDEVFVPRAQAEAFAQYQRRHLGEILERQDIPPEVRSRVFYEVSTGIVRDILSTQLAEGVKPEHLEAVEHLVGSCLDFLSQDSHLKAVTRLMTHDYETYSHSIHVFVFSLPVLLDQGLSRQEVERVAVGAILHDIGKSQLPRSILRKRGQLTEEEFAEVKRHPSLGAAICMHLHLDPMTYHVVAHHHEKMDGSGYPAGAAGQHLPHYVRAITIADIYDALTSHRAYAEAMKPFDAIQLMKTEFAGKIDPGIFQRFVKALSDMVG
jgi:putative nucleotidyltransferase with HDIG domain